MKVKVINKENSDYEKEFKVRRMNYDQVVVTYPTSEGIKTFDNNEVEFLVESEIDKFLIKHKDFLKIRLNRGISVMLYKLLLENIEQQFEEELVELNLLRDKYSVNKRGIWDKEIICVINKKVPLKILANGQNFKKNGYSIEINEMKKEEFFDICSFEIKKIEKEIKEKQEILIRYGKAFEDLKSDVKPYKMLT